MKTKNHNFTAEADSTLSNSFSKILAKINSRFYVSPHVAEEEPLQALKNNVQKLEDLHGRLQFMMTEIRTLVPRK